MNTKHISLAFAAAAALLAGCAKSPIEEVKLSEQFTDLELAYVGAIETKAAIDGTTFKSACSCSRTNRLRLLTEKVAIQM